LRDRDRTVTTVDGIGLFVVDLGPEDGPPIVVLHGGPAAHHDYLLPAFATLADRHRVVLYDQRGGGRSRAPTGADVGADAHVDDLGTVMDALGIDRADLVGYSFGGLWAMLFAARRPERVRKLVLASSVPAHHGYRAGLDRALAAALSSPRVVQEREALERSGLRDRNAEEYRRRRFALSVAGYFVDHRLAHALTPFRMQANTADAIRVSLGDFDVRPEIRSIRADTLVIHGEDDPLDVAHARETAGVLGARLETLPACGHVPYVEAQERFFAILRAFLSAPPGESS
jgi:proline iminopeptidase